ncbi:hypothetical protein Avbf_03493 [Armadillidium vulgare]|nr:hypothetical protein Avbf_03493 [Armadillidium vulgare]
MKHETKSDNIQQFPLLYYKSILGILASHLLIFMRSNLLNLMVYTKNCFRLFTSFVSNIFI